MMDAGRPPADCKAGAPAPAPPRPSRSKSLGLRGPTTLLAATEKVAELPADSALGLDANTGSGPTAAFSSVARAALLPPAEEPLPPSCRNVLLLDGS